MVFLKHYRLKALPQNKIKTFASKYNAYSNSSLSSCYEVFFVGFDDRNHGVLSDFYLLREFLGDCIVILLSVIPIINYITINTLSTIIPLNPLSSFHIFFSTYQKKYMNKSKSLLQQQKQVKM